MKIQDHDISFQFLEGSVKKWTKTDGQDDSGETTGADTGICT